VSLSDSKIRFGLGNAVLTSKLIDGTFPRLQPGDPDRRTTSC
jgi:DNA polymerase III sliding clamp (beta) subunit (PCNA family)